MSYDEMDFGLKTGVVQDSSVSEAIGMPDQGITGEETYEEPRLLNTGGDVYVYQQIRDVEGMANRVRAGRVDEESGELESLEYSELEDLNEALESVVEGPIESL